MTAERTETRRETADGYRLVRPCPKCPFRSDVEPYLRPERVQEIATSIARGGEFYCHQTTVPSEDEDGCGEMRRGPRTQVCAGSLIMQAKAGLPNQMSRVAMSLGLLDMDRLDMDAPVFDSLVQWQDHFQTEEGEPCSYVGPGCEAPAGWMEGGAVVANTTDFATEECSECGQPMCETCLDGHDACPDCRGEEED